MGERAHGISWLSDTTMRRVSAGRAASVLRAMRPLQWVKNAVVLAALVFAARLDDPASAVSALGAVISFCLVSSAVYLLNDLHDVDADRLHPEKRTRPIASGELPPALAAVSAAALLATGLTLAWAVRPVFAAICVAYAALMAGYSYRLKSVAIVDVAIIAVGFVLRAVGGGVAIDVTISNWLLMCTFLLALFLGFGKRRQEFAHLPDAVAHRRNLQHYTLPLLDQLVAASAAATLVAYALYTVEARNLAGQRAMVLTVPIVAFALARYLYLMRRCGGGGSPERVLVSDRLLLAAVAVWGAVCIVLLWPTG